MIPRVDVSLDPAIPADATFWTPKPSELDEEDDSLGYFHDVWIISGVRVRDARRVMDQESAIVEAVDSAAADSDEFEAILRAVESNDRDALPERLANEEVEVLLDVMNDEPPTETLDVGVAGLVYSLASAGFWPAASCRGHGWSPHPVVYFAADRHRVRTLQPLVEATGCGFLIDGERSHLLVVAAASVADFMRLARLVLEARTTFPKPRARRRSIQPGPPQPSLWDDPA